MKPAKPYANPYLAGCGLGLVLLAAFVLAGQGFGASGAFANVATGVVASVVPEAAARNEYFAGYLTGGAPWTAWMVIEIVGVLLGGGVSAWLAGRMRIETARGPNIRSTTRLMFAAAGGALMGAGAVLARGCTSGQALSGGALLSVGSWIFMLAAFAAAYTVAPLVKRLWR